MIIVETISNVGIPVSDLERSISFYKDLFDFDVVEKLSNAGQACLKMGDMVLVLYQIEGYRCELKAGCAVSFTLDEDDFDDALDELNSMDVPVVYGPENIRNGRTVVFTDPDGNRIELAYPKLA